MIRRFAAIAAAALLAASARLAGAPPAPTGPFGAEIAALLPGLTSFYIDLHEHPELSRHEEKTAAKLAARLRELGFEVTEHVGGTGVVGVLRNGPGPTAMLRTELDALPVEEETGLPYASRVKVRNAAGEEVPVMHACGHDVHMTCWVGTATLLSRHRDRWKGTLVLIAQPAEEVANGARAMLDDGLFTRFPRPDYAFAMHDTPKLPAGTVGYTSGYALSSADSVDLTIYGKGGHGAEPQATIDPIVIAARTVVALQTIVSREISPLDPAIITVGSIHGGTKHNIIPSEVKLQMTVRSYRKEVRDHLLAAIERIARGEAEAAGAPRPPEMKVVESCPSTYNDPKLTGRLVAALRARLGDARVVEKPPEMVSEDFSEYGLAGVPAAQFMLGAADPEALARSRKSGKPLPSLHSALYAPDRDPTIETGIEAETAVLLDLLKR
jgi:amidohydrolase